MQFSGNLATSLNVSNSPYQYPQDAHEYNTRPYVPREYHEYGNNMISSSPIAGGLRPPSSSPNPTSQYSLTDTRQELLPSPHDARSTHHGSPVTVPTAIVTMNNMQFSGDHRFPPGRPPIQGGRDISRPNQTAAINAAVAAWNDPIPNNGPTDLTALSGALRNLLHAPPAAANPISPMQLEPFTEMDPASARCDPLLFADPEHEVHKFDCREDSLPILQERRLLPKRGIQRRLNGPLAGVDLPNGSSDSQALTPGTPGSDRNLGKPPPVRVDPVVASPQVMPLRSMPPHEHQLAGGTIVTLRKVDCHQWGRQPETGALLQGRYTDSGVPFVTPGEVRHLDLFLSGKATVDHRETWLQQQIGTIIWMWTRPSQVGAQRMAQEGSLEPRLQVINGGSISIDAGLLPPRICNESCDAPQVLEVDDNSVGSRGQCAVVWQEASGDDGAVAGVSSAGNQGEWPELMPGPIRVERQVATVATAGSSMVTISSLCPAGQTDPPTLRKRRSRDAHKKTSAPSDPAAAVPAGGPDLRKMQQSTSLEEPYSRDSAPREVAEPRTFRSSSVTDPAQPVRVQDPVWMGEPSVSVSEPCLSDGAMSSNPPRRRLGDRRGRKIPHPRPVKAGGGEGGVDPRGAQISSLELDVPKRATVEEAGSGLPLPLEEDTSAALRAAPDRGSTVPVPGPNAAGLLTRRAPERGIMESPVQTGSNSGQGSRKSFPAALSQRREFLGEADSGEGSAPREGLWVSTSRGRKGRQVVDGDGLAGQCPLSLRPELRFPRPGTREMTGIASELVCMGPAGMVSVRFPMQAARRYQGRRGHRRRRKKNDHCRTEATGQDKMARMEGIRPRAGSLALREPVHDLRGEGADRGRAAVRLLATDCRTGTVETSESSPRTGDLLRSGQGLAERWKRQAEKMASVVPDPPDDGLGEDAGSPATVVGSGEDGSGTVGVPSPEEEQKVTLSESPSLPESVETWLMGGGRRMPLELRRTDWSTMQDLGWGSFPDLVAALAWRRCCAPSLGRDHRRLPTIQLVSCAALDIPKDSWPTSWEGLVEHVGMGGYFRKVGTMRGGMDPVAVQQQLNLFDFNRHLDWDNIDQCLTRVRTGGVILPDEMTENMTLAQLLSGCVALQQWDPLAAFLNTQPPEVKAGLIISPARVAALSVIAARPRQESKSPPQWLMSATFAELRFNHLSLTDFVPDPHRANDLRGQILDGIVDRILSVAPEIKTHPQYRLQDLRSDVRLELNLKDLQMETCLFSAIAVLPTGPWISDFYKGVRSLGGRSFPTIVPTDLYIETELTNTDQRVIRAIRSALGVDNTAFRLILDEALGTALRSDARSRDDTVRFTSTGGRGSKRTMEHVSPDSPDSRLLVNMDATGVLLARRTATRLPLQLGPVTISFSIPHCPQQALWSALQPREPAAIRQRAQGTVIDCPVILIGPLPKGSLPAETVRSGARMAELRSSMHAVCRAELQTTDVRFVGKYDKDRSPLFLYMEFGSADAARYFGSAVDHQVPPEFGKLLVSLCGDKASQMQLWSCNLLAECLAVANEKHFRALMGHGQAHPCPLPPPPPPPPPPPGHGAGQVADGREAAASGQDNPGNAGH